MSTSGHHSYTSVQHACNTYTQSKYLQQDGKTGVIFYPNASLFFEAGKCSHHCGDLLLDAWCVARLSAQCVP